MTQYNHLSPLENLSALDTDTQRAILSRRILLVTDVADRTAKVINEQMFPFNEEIAEATTQPQPAEISPSRQPDRSEQFSPQSGQSTEPYQTLNFPPKASTGAIITTMPTADLDIDKIRHDVADSYPETEYPGGLSNAA